MNWQDPEILQDLLQRYGSDRGVARALRDQGIPVSYATVKAARDRAARYKWLSRVVKYVP